MKIGIIGGGAAGLMAAWLLEADHEVTLFESDDRLGGHISTVHIPLEDQDLAVESGFEFFSAPLFPTLCRLLRHLEIQVRCYPLTYTFYDQKTSLALPPFTRERISWGALRPDSLNKLIQFNHFLNAGKQIVKEADTSISVKEFAESIRVTKGFRDGFVYPFYAGAWGAEIEDIKTFAAYDVLEWSLKNKPAGFVAGTWQEIVGGACSYIHALHHQLQSAKVHLSKTVTDITYDGKRYGIASDNNVMHVDALIIATNAVQARHLLHTLPHINQRLSVLDTIDYFHTLIAVHGDDRWMPKEKKAWSVANIFYDGQKSSLTICKPGRPLPLFRSWIMHKENLNDHTLPTPLYALREYYHAKVTVNYFDAQKALQGMQGDSNIWLAGLYMYNIDSHDSALMSAISIAKQIAPQGLRLNAVSKNVQ